MFSRQDPKHAKKEPLSFRPKGEILLRSLAFARDDGPRPVTLAPFASLRETRFSDLFFIRTFQISLARLRGRDDGVIWQYARQNDLVIVSKDNDFRQLISLKGPPPKVVWLPVGNAGTEAIFQLLQDKLSILEAFKADPDAGLLPLESKGSKGSVKGVIKGVTH